MLTLTLPLVLQMGTTIVNDGVLTVRFPASAILYLRCRATTPDVLTVRVELPGGRSAAYDIPAMKAQRYTPEEIFSKGLLFLIPFRIFAHEGRFGRYERDEGLLRDFLSEYAGIRDRLEGLAESGQLTEYVKRTLEEMSGKVLEHIARGHEKVREGVKSIMGGRVLEYEAKTILREGIALGEARGEAKGIASTARRMLVRGVPLEQVVDFTGLSLGEVEALRGESGN